MTSQPIVGIRSDALEVYSERTLRADLARFVVRLADTTLSDAARHRLAGECVAYTAELMKRAQA